MAVLKSVKTLVKIISENLKGMSLGAKEPYFVGNM